MTSLQATTRLLRTSATISFRCFQRGNKTWSAVQSGQPGTLDYKVYLQNQDGSAVSSVHDIPLKASEDTNKWENVFNMVVEVPRWSNAKLEVKL